MAQTKKKKRSTKHRGNAAGMVEARGRTGRKPNGSEKLTPSKAQVRQARLEQPPTWSGAVKKAAIAAVVFAVAVTLLFGRELTQSILLAVFTFVIYVPLSYATDNFVYKRTMAKKARA